MKIHGIIAGHLAIYILLAALSDIWMFQTVFLASIAFGGLLIWVSIHDLETYEIPDMASISLFITGLITTSIRDSSEILPHIFAAFLWGGLFWSVALIFRQVRGRDGLGLGDAKLMAGIGAWLGIIPVISVVFIAAASGILYILSLRLIRRNALQNQIIAFGPFLCLSSWYVWLFGSIGVII